MLLLYCNDQPVRKKLNFENFSTFRYKLALDLFNSPKLNLKMPGEYQIDYAHLKSRYLEEIKTQIDELEKGIEPEEIERAVKLLYEAETVLFLFPRRFRFSWVPGRSGHARKGFLACEGLQ